MPITKNPRNKKLLSTLVNRTVIKPETKNDTTPKIKAYLIGSFFIQKTPQGFSLSAKQIST
jgi:hypothetical protein